MSDSFQSASFIPKKSIDVPKKRQLKLPDSKKMDAFMIAGAVVFGVSVVLAGIAFGYKKFQESQFANQQDELREIREALNDKVLSDLTYLSEQIQTAKQLLANHTVATPLLMLLEDTALASVQYTDFESTRQENGSFLIELTGTTDTYESVALQSDMFSTNEYIQNPVFADVQLDANDDVTFEVSFVVDKDLLTYGMYFQ